MSSQFLDQNISALICERKVLNITYHDVQHDCGAERLSSAQKSREELVGRGGGPCAAGLESGGGS